jgi:hypothetical protein
LSSSERERLVSGATWDEMAPPYASLEDGEYDALAVFADCLALVASAAAQPCPHPYVEVTHIINILVFLDELDRLVVDGLVRPTPFVFILPAESGGEQDGSSCVDPLYWLNPNFSTSAVRSVLTTRAQLALRWIRDMLPSILNSPAVASYVPHPRKTPLWEVAFVRSPEPSRPNLAAIPTVEAVEEAVAFVECLRPRCGPVPMPSNLWLDWVPGSKIPEWQPSPLLSPSKAESRDGDGDPHLSNGAVVAAYLVDHPNASLRMIEKATGVKRSTAQRTGVWRVRMKLHRSRPRVECWPDMDNLPATD